MKVVDAFPRKVREIENVWIPMSDGARLAARVWLPDDAEADPVPAILEYLPYRKRDFTRLRDEPMHHYFAGHGYAGVRVDLRGSGDSDGILLDEYLEQEHDDAVEVIAWIAKQPWCSGRVGMIGISWGGFNALQVAGRRPPALGAIITLCSTDDRYADDAHYMGGCLLNENLTWGSVLLANNACPPDPELVGDRWREMWHERLESAVLFPALWLEHQRRDAYWMHGSVCEDWESIACPVYAVGGWADGYSNAVPRLLAGLQVPRKGLVGPWAHVFPYDAIPGPSIGFLQEAVRWWDRWLGEKGADPDLVDEPMYRVWMQESAPPQPFYHERPGRWVAEASWPSGAIASRRWFLTSGRLAAEAVPEVAFEFTSPQTTGLGGGDWCAFGALGEMPTDQREDDGKSLCFDSEPLDEPLEILGAPVVVLELAADRPCGQVCARLCDVAPDGASTRVSYGLLNLTHREGHAHPEPVVPNQRMRITLALNDAAHAFAPGHTLRLALSTSYWPIAWPSPEPVRLTVFTGASSLELPVRAPRPEDADLPEFDPAEQGPASEATPLRAAAPRRAIERDLASGETLYTVVSDELGGAAITRVEAIDLDVGYTMERRYRINEEDPLSASAEVEQKTLLRRGDWSARVVVRARCSATHDAFRVEGTLEAYEGESPVFERRWDRRIPRDGL